MAVHAYGGARLQTRLHYPVALPVGEHPGGQGLVSSLEIGEQFFFDGVEIYFHQDWTFI